MKNLPLLPLLLLPLCAALANEPKLDPSKETIGVALSGGAARGFAHLGVLQALEDNGIVPTHVSGSSMGAVMGAVYAAGKSPAEIYDYARQQNYVNLFSRPSLQGALFKPVFLEEMLNDLIPHNSFDSLHKTLYVSTTNLNLARNEISSSGVLKERIVASAAIPLVFEPVVIDSFTYVDGGLLNNLPVEPLVGRCKHIIGVTVNTLHDKTQEELEGTKSVLRTVSMVVMRNERSHRQKCDYFIEVTAAGKVGLMEFSRVEDFYSMGYEAAARYIEQNPEILKLSNIKYPELTPAKR